MTSVLQASVMKECVSRSGFIILQDLILHLGSILQPVKDFHFTPSERLYNSSGFLLIPPAYLSTALPSVFTLHDLSERGTFWK